MWRLGENAYGVPIINEIANKTKKKLTLGGLWISLDILCQKGLVSKKTGDPTPERGGKAKIFYSVTQDGLSALKKVRELNWSLWDELPENFINKLKNI